jgi:hypothetical protein
LRRTTYEEVKSLAERRDPEVFRRLDFDRFAGHVCDRVLSRPGDPFQRYTMRVLLRYLFPEERELVQHWLRNKQVGDHFLHRIGARDAIDRKYKAVEVIKLLMSLFTGEVARGVAPPGKDRGLVFLLALDQAEGRAELFDSPSDWSDFFAQLAELYNSLPNVFVLFTMTIALFKELHARMEGQFRDRIRKDQRFILESIPDDEVLNLYRRRVDRWLGPKLANDLVPRREVAGNHYLPFTQVEVLEMSRRLPVRAMLEKFDAEFRRHLTEKVVSEYDVPFDYLCTRKEIATFGESMAGTDARFTEPHLQTVCSLFEQFGGPLAKSAGVEFQQVEWVVTDDYKLDCLQVTACAEGQPQHWVRLVIGRLPYRNFMERVPGCIRLVSGRGRHFKRHRLWLLRSPSLDAAQIDSRDGSVTALDLPPATETTLRAVLDTLKQRGKYPADAWDQGEQFLVAQVRQTYLGDVLTTARALIDQLQRALDAATDESAVLNTPAE